MKRVSQNALGHDYLVAQPIAVKWSPQQTIVWPTQRDGLVYVKCPTERFVAAIIQAVRTQYRVNPRRVFIMSWSSSGRAGYALSLQPDCPIVGSYIVMSGFQPEMLPSAARAQGHA